MTLTFKLHIWQCRDVSPCQISRSKIVSFKSYCPDTQTHAGPIALPGPLKCLQRWSLETRVLSPDCLETRTWFFMSQSWLSLDTCMSCFGSVSSFHVSSCLTFHDCVLSVSLSGIAKCLFCAETLAFLAESKSLKGPFTYLS